ncbi:MAG: hypothetical protein HC853_07705 [Anaerolineae bacterium]|nr:hypothetical protein [Anaerolineae bacterium]
MRPSREDQTLLDWITERFALSASVAIALLGILCIVISHLVLKNGADLADTLIKLFGGILVEAGIIAFLVDRFNLEKLVSVKLPQSLFDHGYLQRINETEANSVIENALQAQLGLNIAPDKIREGRRLLVRSLRTPNRKNYRLTVKMLKSQDCAEVFSLNDSSSDKTGHNLAKPLELLCIEAKYKYITEQNSGNEPIPINGTGIIHHVNDTVPESTELARLFREEGHIPSDKLEEWIRNNIKPHVEINEVEGADENVIIEEARLNTTDGDKLWLSFIVRINHRVNPGEIAQVQYSHFWFVEDNDFYYWTSSASTTGFTFRMIDFDDFDLTPIPTPAIVRPPENSGAVKSYEGSKLELQRDEMTFNGTIYPNSTYTFTWRRKKTPNLFPARA